MAPYDHLYAARLDDDEGEEPGASANARLGRVTGAIIGLFLDQYLRSAPPFLQGTDLEFLPSTQGLPGRGSIAPRLTVGRCLVASAAIPTTC